MALHNESYTDNRGIEYQIEYEAIQSDKGTPGTGEVCLYKIMPDRGDTFWYALLFSDIVLNTQGFENLYGKNIQDLGRTPGLDIIKREIEHQARRGKLRLLVRSYDIEPFYRVDPPKPLTEKELDALAERSTLIPFQRKGNDK